MGASWQATFLAVAFVCSCFLQTQAQGGPISITLIPPNPMQGESIVLRPEGVPGRPLLCDWYRGPTVEHMQLIRTYYPPSPEKLLKGNAYTGHEIVRADCSLLISNLSANYSGNYTLQWTGPGIHRIGTASFKVSEQGLGSIYFNKWFGLGAKHPACSNCKPLADNGLSSVEEKLHGKPGDADFILNIHPNKEAKDTKEPKVEGSSWVIFGPLFALTLVGSLLCISFWVHRLRNKKSIASPLYCNISTSGQKNTRSSSNQTNIYEENTRSTSNQTNVYEDLQHGDQAVYEQLKK